MKELITISAVIKEVGVKQAFSLFPKAVCNHLNMAYTVESFRIIIRR